MGNFYNSYNYHTCIIIISLVVLLYNGNCVVHGESLSRRLHIIPSLQKKTRITSTFLDNNNKSTTKSATAQLSSSSSSSSSSSLATTIPQGGAFGRNKKSSSSSSSPPPPSMYWAVLHNWLYFLSLGFNVINIPFLIRGIVDGDPKAKPSAEAIALSGKVESVDKFLTFAGIGLLSALSDKFGRKPMMAWSALGFMVTNLIQARTTKSIAMLYLADFVDGCSSCMLPLCQAYVTDVSPPSKRAANLGVFQGLSAGCAFILAFPIGGLLGAKLGPRIPLYIAAGLQALNALIILFLTPESNTNLKKEIDYWEDNPIGGLVRLFGHEQILRIASMTYFLSALARCSLDAQFANYSNIRFGWTQAQSGPVLVLVGLMLAIAPRLLVPRLGLKNSILSGLMIFAWGLTGTGLSPTPAGFVFGIFVVSVGCMSLPALTALLANLAKPGERGALLGSVGSLNELTGAIGSTVYATLLAKFTSDNAPLAVPGMHFVFGAMLLFLAWAIALPGFVAYKDHPAFILDESKKEDGEDFM